MDHQENIRILVVDDDQFIRAVLKTYLEQHFEVVCKANGLEAMHWLQEGNETDLVVVDLNMPEMNGYELILQLRSSGFFRNIPVVVLSGDKESDDKIKCLKAGADDYIIKPFNPEEVHIRIENLLRRLKITY